MKEYLNALVEKAKENKDLLIKIGAALAGAAVGAVVATLIVNNQSEELPFEEETEDQDDTTNA